MSLTQLIQETFDSATVAVLMLQMLISSDEFNFSDVKVVWYKNGTRKVDGDTYQNNLLKIETENS